MHNNTNNKIIRGNFIGGSASIFRKKNGIIERGLEIENGSKIWFGNCDIYDFFDNLAMIANYDKFGFINRMGEIVIPIKYEIVDDFSEGHAFVSDFQNTFIIDKNGNETFLYNEVLISTPFVSGVSKVLRLSEDGNYRDVAIVNSEGEFVTSFQFRSKVVESEDYFNKDDVFSEGYTRINHMGKYGYLNISGDLEIPIIYDKASKFSDGLAAVVNNGKAGFINYQNDFVIDPIYEDAAFAYEDLLFVKKEGQWGVINRDGKQLSGFVYDQFHHIVNGMLPIKKKYFWSLLSLETGYKTAARFDIPPTFHEGIIQFISGRMKGVSDLHGNEIVSYLFKELASYRLN